MKFSAGLVQFRPFSSIDGTVRSWLDSANGVQDSILANVQNPRIVTLGRRCLLLTAGPPPD